MFSPGAGEGRRGRGTHWFWPTVDRKRRHPDPPANWGWGPCLPCRGPWALDFHPHPARAGGVRLLPPPCTPGCVPSTRWALEGQIRPSAKRLTVPLERAPPPRPRSQGMSLGNSSPQGRQRPLPARGAAGAWPQVPGSTLQPELLPQRPRSCFPSNEAAWPPRSATMYGHHARPPRSATAVEATSGQIGATGSSVRSSHQKARPWPLEDMRVAARLPGRVGRRWPRPHHRPAQSRLMLIQE